MSAELFESLFEQACKITNPTVRERFRKGSYYEEYKDRPAPDPKDGWVPFGIVRTFYMYPIDCGTGYKFEKAICTPDGMIQGEVPEPRPRDRGLMAFNNLTKDILLQPRRTVTHKSKKKSIFTLQAESNFTDKRKIQLNYLGTPILGRCNFNDTVEYEIRTRIINDNLKGEFKLAYIDEEQRRLLFSKRRYKPEFETTGKAGTSTEEDRKRKKKGPIDERGLLPNFSNYTLINTRSVEYLCSDKSTSHKFFRPQIVVDGFFGTAYHEDLVEEVRIGHVTFNNIIPCTFSDVDHNPRTGKKIKFAALNDRLKKQRKLHEIFPNICSDSAYPVFGINMEMKEDVAAKKRKELENIDAIQTEEDAKLSEEKDVTIYKDEVVYIKYKTSH